MTKLWISTKMATGQVDSENGRIVFAPPIWKRFVGQQTDSLLAWLRRVSRHVRTEEL